MVKIAVMQPYFFPYIGYFQLIHSVDEFIFLDDVNFIKGGWINRNKILVQGRGDYITIPCKKISQNKLIKDTIICFDRLRREKILKKINFCYREAPYFNDIYKLVYDVIYSGKKTISELAIESIKQVTNYLRLKVCFLKSSNNFQNSHLNSSKRILDICKNRDCSMYINPIGGKNLYDKSYFKNNGINLYYLNPMLCEYPQFNNKFIPGLSIIDVLMFNSPDRIMSHLLNGYSLL